MKKFLVTMVLGLLVCGLVQAESSLPKCKGKKVNKWSNCHGTKESLYGHKYVGEFLNGKFHGQGMFTHEGRKYVGQYKNHKRHGQGTYTYANGDKYVGEWKKGKKHGQGTYSYANGAVDKGFWKNNKLIEPN